MSDTPDTDTGQLAEIENVNYGGFWRRLTAFTLDGFIIGILTQIIWIVLQLPVSWRLNLFVVLTWLYFTGFESSSLRATPGKLAVGLRVVDIRGERISFARANARYFGKNFPFILSVFILLLGQISMLGVVAICCYLPFIFGLLIPFNMRKRGLHDFIAKTCVIRPPASVWVNRFQIILIIAFASILPLGLLSAAFFSCYHECGISRTNDSGGCTGQRHLPLRNHPGQGRDAGQDLHHQLGLF